MHDKGRRSDLAIILILLVLPVLFFWPVTVGGKTLLPADNAFAWEPWKSYASEAGVGIPHNDLLSDLYLENYAWKRFIVDSLRHRQLPLWNPYILAGVPFLAAGQHSAMYPLSVLFYLLPIPLAYGWFAAIHLFLAGLFTYILARTLRVGRVGSVLSATTFMFSGFMVIRNVFPMIIAAAVWLPLILASIERIARRAEETDVNAIVYLPDVAVGASAFGMAFLAGHPEMYYYVSLISGLFAIWRLGRMIACKISWTGTLRSAAALLFMAFLGFGLGSAQWLPLLKLVRQSSREGGTSLEQVLGWAYPLRRVISLFVPDFFGNPSHHAYLDLFSWQVRPVTANALGDRIDTVYWGIKNYVEGASYIGILPMLLALVAILRRKGRHLGFFALVCLVSLLFVFGSRLYVLVYKLPGLNQVHSPFRWIYPYTLGLALLAGMGADVLCRKEETTDGAGWWRSWSRRLAESILPKASMWAGLAVLGGLAASLLVRDRFAPLAERVMYRLALAPRAFSDGGMFYSYQFRNLLIFALALFLSGLLLSLRARFRLLASWGALAVILILGELFIIGKPFFAAVEPALVGYSTPAIEFLQSDPDLYRITSYVGGSEKTFNANAGMFYGISDARGYDSIIPRQYADYMGIIQEQSELQYNRIAPIYDTHADALDSPLLDALNVKYVLTNKRHAITTSGYTLVYDDEIRIYRNEEAMPRAFLVPRAISIQDAEERRRALSTLNPREVVILEEAREGAPAESVAPDFDHQVEAIEYTPNEVTITVQAPIPCFLVLADSYFEGWLAFIRPTDARDPSLAEKSLHVYRANGAFRAVQIPAGRYVVRFKYSPNSVKFGLYLSFLSGIVLILTLGLWAWHRFYRESQDDTDDATVQRVSKNTLAPIALNVVNKVIDMAFAMLMLRILGPVDAGRYSLAIVVIGWLDIFTNFGLNTLSTREVARDKTRANRYLSNTIALRVGLWGVSLPVLAAFFLLRRVTKPLDPATILAVSFFALGLLPSNISASLAAVFSAYERMEIPASVTTLTTLLKVTLGTVALIVGAGYVGLAAISIIVNIATAIVLYLLVRATLFRPRVELDWGFQKQMLSQSYPLMINLLLATLFFKVAVLLIEWLEAPRALGWYGAAYKYIDAAQIIPAYFTMALFPVISRYAATARDSLLRAYRLAIKLLLIVALPGALIGWALSTELITVLGGSQYLPHAAYILRVMIWYMPFGFINSVTQYVLIALNQQRFLTRAFAIGLAFNVAANLIFISRFGYIAAAFVTVASELALFVPFYVGVRKHLTRIPWIELAWKQLLSSLPLALMLLLLPHLYVVLSILAGLSLYVAGISFLHVFDREETDAVRSVLPLDRIKRGIATASSRPVDSVPSRQ